VATKPALLDRTVEEFRRTLTEMKKLPAKTWITSHHKGVITERETFLVLLAAFAARLNRLVVRGLGAAA